MKEARKNAIPTERIQMCMHMNWAWVVLSIAESTAETDSEIVPGDRWYFNYTKYPEPDAFDIGVAANIFIRRIESLVSACVQFAYNMVHGPDRMAWLMNQM